MRRNGLARWLIGLVAGALCGWPSAAMAWQAPLPVADSARRLDSLARSLDLRGSFTPEKRDRAVRLWSDAATLARRGGDRALEGAALLQAGRWHADPDSSVRYLRAALGIAREVGDRVSEGHALMLLGTAEAQAGRYAASLPWLRAAAQVARDVGARWREDRTVPSYMAGHAYRQLSQLDSAEVYYREAARIARASGEPREEALALGEIGNIHAQRGRFDSTLVYYQRALDGFRAAGNRALESTWLHNVGGAHMDLGRLDSALVYYRQALAMARQSGRRGIEAAAHGGIGSVLLQLDRPDSAAAYFRAGVRIAQQHGHGTAWGQVGLGEAQSRLGQRDSALVTLRAALAAAQAVGDRPLEAHALDLLGLAHAEAGRADSALAAFHDALRAARTAEAPTYASSVLQHLGDFHARATRPGDLARAVAYYDSASAARSAVAAAAGGDQNRVSYAEAGVELVDRWALAWLARAGEVGGEASALAALAVSERGRAQALLELLRRGRGGVGAPGRATTTARAAGDDLVQDGRALATTARAARAPVLTYLATRDTLLVWLLLPSGEVHLARHPVSRDSVATLAASLRETTLGDAARVGTLRAIEDDALPGGGRRAARATGASSAAALGQAMPLLLPAALSRQLPADGEVVIIPHGPLALVPFALLLAADGESPAPVMRHAFRYAPSLATLQAVQGSADPAAPRPTSATMHGRAVVVGNPAMPRLRSPSGRTVHLPPLPAAEREGAWVARKLGVAPLVGRTATERAVGDRLADASVIHLATHGFAYSADARALDSFVALAADSMPASDGLLRVGEILDAPWRLSAELVVLSACETGLGNLKQAEGTVGLQRAFLAKGARSVLVSLWNVSDEATELLMRRFYTHWLDDHDRPSKAEALRRAQEDVRRTAGFAHPRYWAAFQLVGG